MLDQVEDQRHVNPSGIPDEGSKQPQPIEESHHEEGHVDPPEQDTPAAGETVTGE